MKLTRLLAVLLVAFGLLFITMLSLLHMPYLSQAQGGAITMTKTLNRSSNVVRVGEVLTFTIALTNSSGFTLTNVTLIDHYEQNIMGFAWAAPAQNLLNTGSGLVTWTNVATPPIPPGQSISVTVALTVEHPQAATVNAAKAQDIVSDMGATFQNVETNRTQDAIGGRAPVFKSTSPFTFTPQAGLPITFTHVITNDGAALMTFLPLTDTYNPTYLEFNFAVPTPSITSPPGLLVWSDLTTYFGSIAPFETVVVTTVFTATTQVINTVNQASTKGARDEYNNNLAPGLALVPIIIIDTSSTNNGGDTSNDDDDDDDDDDDGGGAPAVAPTPAPVATVTPVGATATATLGNAGVFTESNTPRYLPETGHRSMSTFAGLIVVLLALLMFTGYLLGTRTP